MPVLFRSLPLKMGESRSYRQFPQALNYKVLFLGRGEEDLVSMRLSQLFVPKLSLRPSGSLAGRIGWMHSKIMPNIDTGSKNSRQNSWELPTSNLVRNVIGRFKKCCLPPPRVESIQTHIFFASGVIPPGRLKKRLENTDGARSKSEKPTL